jgi:hypothetical protein
LPKGSTGLVFSALEGDVDIYTIIFAAHAMVHAETCPAMA